MLMTNFRLPDKMVFRVREVARILGVSAHTIKTAMVRDEIAYQQGTDILGNPAKWLVIPRSEVERLARQKGLIP